MTSYVGIFYVSLFHEGSLCLCCMLAGALQLSNRSHPMDFTLSKCLGRTGDADYVGAWSFGVESGSACPRST